MFGSAESERSTLTNVKLFSKNSNLCDHNPPTSQTDRQTTCDHKTALCTKVHRAVKIDAKFQRERERESLFAQ